MSLDCDFLGTRPKDEALGRVIVDRWPRALLRYSEREGVRDAVE